MKPFSNHIIFGILILFTAVVCRAEREVHQVISPDGNIEMAFFLAEGEARYTVLYNGAILIEPSALGYAFKEAEPLTGPFTVDEVTHAQYDETWATVWGESDSVRNHYRQMKVNLKETAPPNRSLELTFRAFNDGVAFRYHLPEQDALTRFNITSEETAFRFSEDAQTWWIPADYDSYERLYSQTQLSEVEAVNTPFTLKYANGVALSIHEANLTDYAGMTLGKHSENSLTLICDLVPWPDGVKVKGETPHVSPWRTIQIAANEAGLLTSKMILNLNEPNALEDVSWIKPMKYVGIWWGMHIDKYTWYAGPKHGATSERTKRYMDFAAKHNIPGVLVEGWNKGWESWLSGKNVQDYTQSYPDFDPEEVVRYGREKDVFLIGHHESGGNVPHYEQQMEAAFKLYADLGVPAVKTGYAGTMSPEGQHHHGQWMVNHYRRVVETAARYKIMIDAHEPIKDTGIRRTYPNMLTREGARGMEYNAWSPGNPPEHTTILPFTRLLAGPMDYTPGIFNFDFDSTGLNRVRTTLAKQLAYYVVIYSPMQMAADLVEHYEGHPAFAFIEQVPVDWDETRILHARIGDYVSFARRSADRWYVGTVSDEKARRLRIQTDFLKKDQTYLAHIYTDGMEADWYKQPTAIEIGTYVVAKEDYIEAPLSPGGGQAIEFVPVDKEAAGGYPHIGEFNATAARKMMQFEQVREYGQPINVENDAMGAIIELKTDFDRRYSAGGPQGLIDGGLGTERPERHWLGFKSNDFEADIDLGAVKAITGIEAEFLKNHIDDIFLPASVTIEVSEDGEHYEQAYNDRMEQAEKGKPVLKKRFGQTFKGLDARYIRVKAENIGQCPPWHKSAGKPAWMLIDEIIVKM